MSSATDIGNPAQNNDRQPQPEDLEEEDDHANSTRQEDGTLEVLGCCQGDLEEVEEGEEELPAKHSAKQQEERTVTWLALQKQMSESRCRELEAQLLEARKTVTKQATSLHVAEEKIRHLETESKGMLDMAEFRENEACSVKEGVSLAEERAHAHQKALASALEQLSNSGMSQSKKLMELADVNEELRRTRVALERAERLVFEQRQEADERQRAEERRRAETDALGDKLAQAERKNTELMAKDAAGRLAKKMKGNFGRSSTFCSSFCSCFRSRPAYRRVSSPATLPTPSGTADTPWLT